MHIIADAIAVQSGWRRVAVAMFAGGFSALSLAPWFAFPVLWLSLPILVWQIDGAVAPTGSGRLRGILGAAIVGWSFGFGYFLAGLWWIGLAFLVEADKFAWLLPIAVIALPAGLALFWGLAAAAARLFWSNGWPRLLVLAVVFSLAEWLRGHVLTGFPWNAIGYALTPSPLMMQSASVVGLWGLTLAAFIVFSAPAVLAARRGETRAGAIAYMLFAALVLLAHVGFGAVRLANAPDIALTNMPVRIVQPAIAQNQKWLDENQDEIFDLQLQLSKTATPSRPNGIDDVKLLVWPESSFPFYLSERPDASVELAELLPVGTTLFAGAARAAPAGPGAQSDVFNSIFVIDHQGEVLDAYDKVHLVPFGEYLPFQEVLEGIGLRQLAGSLGGFAAGSHLRTLDFAGVPRLASLICYEIIFPGAVTEIGNRPDWILNVTNDAWFGDTPGPRQHFLQARLRAVEEGLPLVRAANSGISAIVDGNGRVIASLGVDQAGVVDGNLPASLPATFYGRFGDLTFWILLATFAFAATIGKSGDSESRI